MLRFSLTLCCWLTSTLISAAEFRARIIDHDTSKPIPARVYLTHEGGEELFVESADPDGTAVIYREQWVPMEGSSEKHTTVSAHPFKADLQPGKYQLTIERGKEYFPLTDTIEIGDDPVDKTFKLRRWIDLPSRGWYSGETHVHRHFEELPNVVQAEDLNVAFPVSYWTTSSLAAPSLNPPNLARGNRSPYGPRKDHGADPIFLDRKHVILPRNTEYEIFSVGETRHTLGAIFLLNHQSVFELKAPPIAEIARKAHAEGALLDLDKHSWPWSMMLVPVAKIDLFELSNNHVWRTNFGFKSYQLMPADWMNVEYEAPGKMTEWGWLNYGWEVYYALLNCGFRLAPTAGTASGVHPVPLGWSRVYVHTGDHLTVDEFLEGLRQGRSFVTTGPMLFAKVNGKLPGEVFSYETQESRNFEFEIETVSAKNLSAIEVLVNGKVVKSFNPQPVRTPEGAVQSRITGTVKLDDSGWIAVRAIEPQPDGRRRFAHTGCWHIEMDERPVIPRKEQVDWLIELMEEQIKRNRGVLSEEALAEFEQALQVYREIRQRAQ
jgi:hypothetical protein